MSDPREEAAREIERLFARGPATGGGPGGEERIPLAPAVPPPGLLDRALARLEREGLIGTGADVPPGLFDATMARLEAEGLVATAHPERRAEARRASLGPESKDAPRSLRLARLRAAAALLVAAGLGAAAAWALKPPGVVRETVREVVHVDRPVEVERLVTVERPVEVERVVERVVEKVVERPVRVEVEKIVVVEKPAPPPPAAETVLVRIDAAGAVARWDAAARRWRPVPMGSAVEALALARTGAGTGAGAPAADPRLPAPDEPDAARIPRLIDLAASGSPDIRARALRELEAAWRRIGEPGPDLPGVLANIASFASRANRGDFDPRPDRAGPPDSVRGWEEWWRRARDRR